jgi:hypothetical protein
MKNYRIAYDCDLRKVGCVLLQAALGGTVPNDLFHRYFSPESWLLAPTPNLKCYPVTEAQLSILAAKTDFQPQK